MTSAWIDRHRFWLVAVGAVSGIAGIALELGGRIGVATHVTIFMTAVILMIVVLARARMSSRLVLGGIACVPLAASAVIGAFIEPGHHPEMTVLLVVAVLAVVVVGFPIGLYTDP